MKNDSAAHSVEIIPFLKEKLPENKELIILHEHILHKGNLIKLLGNAVVTDKISLLEFIQTQINENDLRTYRILQVSKPDFVIHITDEDVAVLYVLSKK